MGRVKRIVMVSNSVVFRPSCEGDGSELEFAGRGLGGVSRSCMCKASESVSASVEASKHDQ